MLRLLTSPLVWAYFVALGWSWYDSARRTRAYANAIACSILAFTWFLIVRFTIAYVAAGSKGDVLMDAYADVLEIPHFGTSAQLLVWVVVATVWMHNAPPAFIVFGMLGAMSGAFAMWLPTTEKGVDHESPRKIPICFAITSALALVAIVLVEPDAASGAFPASFDAALKALHVLLVTPLFLAAAWPSQWRIDGTVLYAALAVACANWHVQHGGIATAWAWPVSDCQISITFDLVCCSVITLVAVHRRFDSFFAVALAAFIMPIVSPACVLALYLLASHIDVSHAELVVAMQLRGAAAKRGADQSVSSGWMNLGLWPATKTGSRLAKGCTYDEACAALAHALGEHANLSASDAVLSCGCGAGAELHYWKEHFNVREVMGVEPASKSASSFVPSHNVRLVPTIDATGLAAHFPQRGKFDAVLALDNIYHYNDKEAFFKTAANVLLCDGGRVAVSDVILGTSNTGATMPWWLHWALRAMRVRNVWTAAEYIVKLRALGFADVRVEHIGNRVLNRWLPRWMSQRLDYGLIVATRRHSAEHPAPLAKAIAVRKRVAIVGSGLSGLAAAHALTSSGRCAELDVVIFERGALPGLSGSARVIDGVVVDCPLRMIGHGYYDVVEKLISTLNVPTVTARSDCCFDGEVRSSSSQRYAPFSLIAPEREGRECCATLTAFRFCSAGQRFARALQSATKHNESVGDWLDRHGLRGGNGDVASASDAPTWALMGQLSWVLSCSYEQVRGYPAEFVLKFVRDLQLGAKGLLRRKKHINRVDPSIDALQLALSHGATMRTSSSVVSIEPHDGERELVVVVDVHDDVADDASAAFTTTAASLGTATPQRYEFDAVIIATEANIVHKILPRCGKCFRDVVYQPSSIVVHTDSTLMPPRRTDWRALNVTQRGTDASGMSQLTVWLNSYYPDETFTVDTFETWNALHAPREGSVLGGEAFFQRVVHTAQSERILKEIEREQGKDSIWFAGSYAVEGMGLLEQAAVSGQRAAAGVLCSLFDEKQV